ncbi:head GIN domain-containing protein [Solitalea lacus]|uniref:head GIN domain-containing protein n=1 Tax=Solitalea lacus TaxID=2911172 RepID=UPI001EDB3FD3|nr:head GIN domain-containing protein [Solitalea lacus]UKJ09294.1 DUF2807 domain-containing protein [Solitalea lacus]
MKKLTLILFAFLGLSIISSCRNTIEGSGYYVTETRALGEINAVTISGDFDVVLHKDSVSSVRIYAEDNIVPEIVTELNSNNSLSIYYRDYRSKYDHGRVDIYVPVKNLRAVDLQSSGSIHGTPVLFASEVKLNISGSGEVKLPVNTEKIYSNMSGSGLMELWGTATNTDQSISSSGKIRSFGLVSKDVKVSISGSGTCEVNATQTLDATISGSGNIIYMGNPQVTTHISGSGKVKKY